MASDRSPKKSPTDSYLFVPLPSKFFERSTLFGLAHSLPDLVGLFALLSGIALLPWPFKILCALGVSVVGYRFTFVIHDCSHATLFRSKTANKIVGWIFAGSLITSFPMFQRLHNIHHKFYREESDPQGVDYLGLQPGRDRVLWHLLKPLFFLNLIDKAANSIALAHCGMTRKEKKETEAQVASAFQQRALMPYLCILGMQTLIFLVVTGGLTFLWGYLLFVVPLVSVGLFLSRVRSYLEHGDLVPSEGSYRIARTHLSNLFERNLLCALLFNYHHEHHLWPRVPSKHLPAVHAEYTRGKLPDFDYEPSYWASLKKLIRACR